MNGPGGRSARGGRREASGSGVGTRGILLLLVAVVIGVVLLQDLDSPAPVVTLDATTTTTVLFGTEPDTLPELPSTTSRPPSEVKVLVVNAASTNGLAGRKSDEVRAAGYTTLKAVTALNNTKVATTSVQYADDYEEHGRGVARVLGLSPDVVTALSNPPVESVGGANVIVILGADADPPPGSASTSTTATTLG